jgi:hypothetical protein
MWTPYCLTTRWRCDPCPCNHDLPRPGRIGGGERWIVAHGIAGQGSCLPPRCRADRRLPEVATAQQAEPRASRAVTRHPSGHPASPSGIRRRAGCPHGGSVVRVASPPRMLGDGHTARSRAARCSRRRRDTPETTRRRVGSDRQWRAGVNRSRPVGGRAQAAKGPGNARGDADVRPAGWTGAGGGGGPPCCTRPARRWSQGTPVAGSRAHARCGSAKTAATEPPRVGLTGTSAGARPGCAAPVRRPGERDGTARRRRRGSRHPASRGS